jgi:hypothetical protein
MTSVSAMASEATFLMAQFLDWVDRKPRCHADLREAWSSTCPLNCAWEDAISQDLVRYAPDGTLVLTDCGRARLTAAGAAVPKHRARSPAARLPVLRKGAGGVSYRQPAPRPGTMPACRGEPP